MALFADSAASRRLFQFLLVLLVFGEIAEDEHDAADLTAGIANRRAAVVDRQLRAIFSNEKRVIGETNDNTGAHDLLDRVLDRRAREFVDDLEDVGDWTERRIVETPAGQFFRDGVHESNAAERVGDDDAIADTRERDGKQIFLALNFDALFFDFGAGRFARRDRAHDAPIGPANEKQIRQSGESESDRACARGGVGRAMFRFQGRFLLILQPLDFDRAICPSSRARIPGARLRLRLRIRVLCAMQWSRPARSASRWPGFRSRLTFAAVAQ